MYMERYAEDEAAGKVYFDFLPGLYDAAVTRNPTHHLEDWQVGCSSFSLFIFSVYISFSCSRYISITHARCPRMPPHRTHVPPHDAAFSPALTCTHPHSTTLHCAPG